MSLFKEGSFLVWYSVKNWDESRKFYEKSLALKTLSESEGWIEYDSGTKGTIFAICQCSGESKASNGTVCFEVEDLDNAMATLKDRSVKFDDKVVEIDGHVKIATFHDPSGNTLQLVELLHGKDVKEHECCGGGSCSE